MQNKLNYAFPSGCSTLLCKFLQTLHESEWNCDRLWYVVKYSTPQNQGFRNLTRGEDHVIFDSEPFTQWTFEVQAANPSGETQWSRPVTAQTEGTGSFFRMQCKTSVLGFYYAFCAV
ncbi:unnamed protein product [Gongylonema pulchrum]|uniref:Fibronectin type-III domain-containing protein n=1 Tax=Gongylonema pulchrum TaxID=637853 RepID=A0A183E026_9BILA|nr:unnamed protein product [Gongylonema pulchrum]